MLALATRLGEACRLQMSQSCSAGREMQVAQYRTKASIGEVIPCQVARCAGRAEQALTPQALGRQEEYKKIDLTMVCADGSKVDIPGAAAAAPGLQQPQARHLRVAAHACFMSRACTPCAAQVLSCVCHPWRAVLLSRVPGQAPQCTERCAAAGQPATPAQCQAAGRAAAAAL